MILKIKIKGEKVGGYNKVKIKIERIKIFPLLLFHEISEDK